MASKRPPKTALAIVLRRLYHAVGDLHWTVLLFVLLLHMLVSWQLLRAAGEADLVAPVGFLYYYATTATTVGYGDLTPKSDMGRMVTSFFIFPGAIAAFTTLIAKAFGALSASWRRRRQGHGNYARMTGGTILVGYDRDRTPRMIDELVADGAAQIVLLATDELDNDDERFRYVRARSLTAPADLARAGIADAAKIIVFGRTDAETLSAGLAVTAMNNNGGHIVCFFHDEENAHLLTAHCPEVEVVLARSVELVVKALNDPGSSHLLAQLVSHTDAGATLFSMTATRSGPFRETADALRERGATLLATASADDRAAFRFDVFGNVAAGDRLFYVAAERLAPA
ncbi:MAG TPA: ion channel [Sphingomonadaceae bacterium]|nr:ion channel [Sphingomonadaceae bacterium]